MTTDPQRLGQRNPGPLPRYRRAPPLLAPLLQLLARLDAAPRHDDDAKPEIVAAAQDAVVRHALRILARRLQQPQAALTSPEAVRDYLRLLLAGHEHELFVVLFVDSQHRLIAAEEMFRGTLAQTSVYP